MDRENIATIAPWIVMWSTWTSRMIIKQRVDFAEEDKCGGSVGGGRNETPTFILENIVVYLNTYADKRMQY